MLIEILQGNLPEFYHEAGSWNLRSTHAFTSCVSWIKHDASVHNLACALYDTLLREADFNASHVVVNAATWDIMTSSICRTAFLTWTRNSRQCKAPQEAFLINLLPFSLSGEGCVLQPRNASLFSNYKVSIAVLSACKQKSGLQHDYCIAERPLQDHDCIELPVRKRLAKSHELKFVGTTS